MKPTSPSDPKGSNKKRMRLPKRLISIVQLASLSFLPFRARILCFVALGVLIGLGVLLAKVSRVTSYLSDDPMACVNCHVMRPEYASWRHSSHAAVATCNDCHVPHDSKLAGLAFKARDGIYHSTIFTLRLEPEVIQLSSGAIPVVQSNCVRCHAGTVENIYCPLRDVDIYPPPAEGEKIPWCWTCHSEVPHGRVHGLSSSPGGMAPELPPVLRRQVPMIKGRPAKSE